MPRAHYTHLSDTLTFKIGGKNKTRRQIASLDPTKAYTVKDDIEHATLHSISLWMFGFLY